MTHDRVLNLLEGALYGQFQHGRPQIFMVQGRNLEKMGHAYRRMEAFYAIPIAGVPMRIVIAMMLFDQELCFNVLAMPGRATLSRGHVCRC